MQLCKDRQRMVKFQKKSIQVRNRMPEAVGPGSEQKSAKNSAPKNVFSLNVNGFDAVQSTDRH
jgi:hypothetical protein